MKSKVPALYKIKEECCGCSACYAICPNHAIKMISDSEGFEYPIIDENKCVGCMMCKKVCAYGRLFNSKYSVAEGTDNG